jgi:hypothetical protein
MNISIIGPEESGKSTLAKLLAKKAAIGRPINFIGKLKSDFNTITVDQFYQTRNAVNIFDDTNAFLEQYDLQRKAAHLKEPVIMSRHYGLINIFVFHSIDDAVKFFFRQSRYIYISDKYRDQSFHKNKFISGIMPVIIGKRPYTFQRFKRY